LAQCRNSNDDHFRIVRAIAQDPASIAPKDRAEIAIGRRPVLDGVPEEIEIGSAIVSDRVFVVVA
jgi:hypothetical protein